MTFWQYMMRFPHEDPVRLKLAADMKKNAPKHRELKTIDSRTDLMTARQYLTDPEAMEACDGDLWCEYLAAAEVLD